MSQEPLSPEDQLFIAVQQTYASVANAVLGEVPTLNALDGFMGRVGGRSHLSAYRGKRDYGTVLGYEENPDVGVYYERYRRGIAKALIDIPPRDTWRRPPVISEDGNIDTEFAQAWMELEKSRRVWSYMRRADVLARIGRYGVLFLGVRSVAPGGGEQLDEETTDLDPISPEQRDIPEETPSVSTWVELSQPVEDGSLAGLGVEGLVYLRALSERSVQIQMEDWNKNPFSSRYGMPEFYTLTIGEEALSIRVHWSRVIHVAEDLVDSEIFAIPTLEPLIDLLHDITKLIGGGAEAAWVGSRPGGIMTNQPGYVVPQGDQAKRDRAEQIEEYLHGIARIIALEGVDFHTLSPAVADLGPQIDKTLDLIAMVSGIPKRVLMGSAAGELASAAEDTRQWHGSITARQQNYAEQFILRPFIDRLIAFGILPTPANGYNIGELQKDGKTWAWPSLQEEQPKEEAETLRSRMQAAGLAKDRKGRPVLTRKETRVLLGHDKEVPTDMEDDEDDEPQTIPMGENPLFGGTPPGGGSKPPFGDDEDEDDEEDPEANRLRVLSHNPVEVPHICPLCRHTTAYSFADHGPLLVCAGCLKTYDPTAES